MNCLLQSEASTRPTSTGSRFVYRKSTFWIGPLALAAVLHAGTSPALAGQVSKRSSTKKSSTSAQTTQPKTAYSAARSKTRKSKLTAARMTARYPPHHGIRDNAGFVLNDATPTLASILKGAGYHTAAFVSSYVLRAGSGLARGFDVYDERFDGLGTDHLTLTSLERRGPEVARAAVAWLAHAPRPYFLWVHFYDPHAPYDPPPAFGDRFPGRPYDGEIATSDFGVATLLEALPTDRSGTIVVATGDHGEGLGDHGESQHGILLYDSTLHVPLIMTGPGIPPDVRVTRQVRHVDVLPTILAMAGIPVPAGVDGASLRPLLDRTPARPTDDAPLAYAETQFGLLHFGWAPLASGRDGRWKYIDAPAPELYDLGADRSETANRFAPGGTAAGIARKVREIGSTSQPLRARAGDTDVRERLRSLGYASGRVDLGSPSGSGDPKIEIVRYEAYVQAFNDGLMARRTPALHRFAPLGLYQSLLGHPHQ